MSRYKPLQSYCRGFICFIYKYVFAANMKKIILTISLMVIGFNFANSQTKPYKTINTLLFIPGIRACYTRLRARLS